jgi:hypothetical protein
MSIITNRDLQARIFTIRGIPVMLDFHLAELYKVETKRINEQVKRNEKRFPEHYMFQLSEQEWTDLVVHINQLGRVFLRSQIATAKRRTLPYAFTEQGVAMLSAVLNSEIAIAVSIQVIDAFVEMRHLLAGNVNINQGIDRIESRQLEAEKRFEFIINALETNKMPPSKGIFFDGQLFDAYVFVNKLIKGANNSVILLDNYVDETTLLILSKRNLNCKAIIYTQKINVQLQLDLAKHNLQYPSIEINELKNAHDRFLILDDKELYHIGASIKDLGKKWFAFSKMDDLLPEIKKRL